MSNLIMKRNFNSTSFVKNMSNLRDDEFLPEFEEKEIKHQRKLESSITVAKKPDNMLKHQEEYGGILYKYDLPVENRPIQFKSALMVKEEVPNTPTENLFESLEIDKETAYESFIIKLNQNFNNEIDMYGDLKRAGESSLKVSIYFE